MAGDQRSLEILIRAKDLASAEFQKTASWLDALSGKSVATTAAVEKGFKGGVLTSIRDSVKELKAFVAGFSLIQIGRHLVNFVEEWVEVRKKTREAREEFELYLNLRGAQGGRRRDLQGLRDSLLGSGDFSEQQGTSISALADRFKIVRGEAEQLAKDAQLLASRLSEFKGDPVTAFTLLAKASAGASDELAKRLGVEEKGEKIVLAIRRERLAIEQDLIAAQAQAASIKQIGPDTFVVDKELEAEAKAARELAKQLRAVNEERGGLKNPDPDKAIRAKADLILLDAQIRNTRAKAEKDARGDFTGGLSQGFKEFRDELTNFREQGIQTMRTLLGGVSEIGAGFVEALILRTSSAREALKKFAEDMLRMLARLAAQLAVNRLIGALFAALGNSQGDGKTDATIGTGKPGAAPTPGAPGTGIGKSSYGDGYKSIGPGARDRLSGGNGPSGGVTVNLNVQVLDSEGLSRVLPRIIDGIKRALRGDRDFQLEIKGAAA